MRCLALVLAGLLLSVSVTSGDEKLFSGPQAGEKLPGFKVVGVYDDQEGKEMDFVKQAGGKPVLLIFVHELTRPSAALTRALTTYGASRQKDGLNTYIIWLHRDRTEAANYLKRARRSLNFKVPVGISLDGAEGPGAYGLNRKMGVTILVGKNNKVTANFALVQPSVTDAPKIAAAVVKQTGGKAPTLRELETLAGIRRAAPAADARLVELLRGVIRKDATPEEVKKAAAAVEKYVGTDRARLKELGRIAAIAAEKKYGTEEAQKQMKAWAEKYGGKER
jgi:hypothetical protein